MINQKTGAIRILGEVIVPHWSEDKLHASHLGVKAERSVSANGWTIYHKLGDSIVDMALRFKDSRLVEVELCLKENRAKRWDDWSESLELDLKRKHDVWLETLLGKPPYQFEWGQVQSIYDKRAGSSSIIIRYSES